MIRSIGLPPTAQVPAVSRQIVAPVSEVPQWVMVLPSGVTAPPPAISISVPEALDREAEVGVLLRVTKIPLTS